MVYLLDTDLPNNKKVSIALIKIFGIGAFTSLKICKRLGFASNLKIKDLNSYQKIKLVKVIENSNFLINTDLKKTLTFNQKRLVSIKSYKGIRKVKGLPIRGQRTHTNAKTARKFRY